MGFDDHSINGGYSSMNIDSPQPPSYQQHQQQQQQQPSVQQQLTESLPYGFYQQNQTAYPQQQQYVPQPTQQQQQQQSSLYYNPQQQSMVYPSTPVAAPPQFDNAHDLKRCLKCTKIYYHIDSFNNQACSYHRDKYVIK
ncbi:hypothetical protein DFA_09670 [Cavenderia fasciculata]|uniref:Uncharacterized protein n=1 Tax=Cavenderia fasciculata TaxID=261658 RepID=F4Q898_CACFS|nr:uncharacterized protein DFA_09670 [Cavenderia fasciculata]EGG15998.1 hypothetical protein DFA_09670 [Cavenderia fasciculata]|eukprot:XP_004352323.1 hypothetical protein DFA_09670 [Cavenderia fasciculata]